MLFSRWTQLLFEVSLCLYRVFVWKFPQWARISSSAHNTQASPVVTSLMISQSTSSSLHLHPLAPAVVGWALVGLSWVQWHWFLITIVFLFLCVWHLTLLTLQGRMHVVECLSTSHSESAYFTEWVRLPYTVGPPTLHTGSAYLTQWIHLPYTVHLTYPLGLPTLQSGSVYLTWWVCLLYRVGLPTLQLLSL